MLDREVGFALNNGRCQTSLSGPKSVRTGSGGRLQARRQMKAAHNYFTVTVIFSDTTGGLNG
jgi:hypothetical protein